MAREIISLAVFSAAAADTEYSLSPCPATVTIPGGNYIVLTRENLSLHPDLLSSIGKTEEELSLVCRTEDTPSNTIERDDGWKGFYIRGVLDFSLIGILSKLSGILAEHKIGLFAVSTFNTDYILVKEEQYERALAVLSAEGYTVM